MSDYYRKPETRKRPGDVAGGSVDERYQCSPQNPFGQPNSDPSLPQMRAADGTSRTEAQYLRDQMKSVQEFRMAMHGPLIYTSMVRVIIGIGRIGKVGAVLGFVDTVNRLRKENVTEVGLEKLPSKLIEIGTDLLAAKIPGLKGSEDVIARVTEDIIREGGGRISEMWQERRQEKQWSKDQNNIQRAIDRSEHRQRVKPGDTMEA